MFRSSNTPSTILASATLAGALLMAAAAQAATLAEIRDSGTLRVAIADEVPYGYTDDNGDVKGAGPDVAKHIATALGIERIEWVTTSFDDLIPGLQEDRFDMVAAEMAILPERCQRAAYSEPNTSYGEGLLVKAGNPEEISAYDDFAQRDDIDVAILNGANQREILQALGVPEERITPIASNADAIEAITSERADAYAGTGLTVSALDKRSPDVEVALNFNDPVVDGQPVRSWGGFTFAKGNDALRDAVNEQLIAYKDSEAWEQTLAGYGFTQDDILGSFKYTTAVLCGDRAR